MFCNYPISFPLKQSCDNNVVNCVHMIYTEVLCCLEHQFKAYTRIKKYNFVSRIDFLNCSLVLHSHRYPTHSFINVDTNSCICSI